MVSRSIIAAEEDMDAANAIPVINHVGVLQLQEAKVEETDQFAHSAEELKSYQGTSAVFKRRVSTELKKYHRGTNGAESRQIKDEYTGYDAFGVVEPPYNLNYLAQLYELSSPHYAAVNAKTANIVGLGFRLVETSKTKRSFEAKDSEASATQKARNRLSQISDALYEKIEDLNEEETFTEILTKIWRDYETTGNGYLEVGRSGTGEIAYFGHIPSQTMRIRRQRDGFVQVSGPKVQFFRNFGEEESYNPVGNEATNEVIHIKKYSPTSSFYGIPDIIAAKNAVAGNEFASRFNLDYFENKAIPRHLITLKGAKLGPLVETKLLQFFETQLKGQNHRSLFIPLPGSTKDNPIDFKIEPIENKVQDSSFDNYRKGNDATILMAHRVPITKVSIADGTNLAVARDADKTFKEQVCGPEQRVFEKKLNRIVKEFTDAFELRLNEMTLTDELTQSQIDERMVTNGIQLPNEIRTARGWAAIPGGDERVDPNAKAKQQQASADSTRSRDSQRAAARTDSNGEGRNPKGQGRTNGVT